MIKWIGWIGIVIISIMAGLGAGVIAKLLHANDVVVGIVIGAVSVSFIWIIKEIE